MLIKLAGPEKDMQGLVRQRERRKEAADLIVTLNGCVFGSVQTSLQEYAFAQ